MANTRPQYAQSDAPIPGTSSALFNSGNSSSANSINLSPSEKAQIRANMQPNTNNNSLSQNLTEQEKAQIRANMLPATSEGSGPSINPIMHPIEFAQAHNDFIPTRNNLINLGKDIASGTGEGLQDITKSIGNALSFMSAAPGPLTPFDKALGVNPQANFNAIANPVSNALSPVLNYPLAYKLNAPIGGVNAIAQGISKGIPLMAAKLNPEDLIANIVGGATSQMALNPNQSPIKEALEGGALGLVGSGLYKSAKAAGNYLFSKSGQVVDQLERSLSQVSTDKNDALQTLDAEQSPIDTTGSDSIAELNKSLYPTMFNSDLNDVSDGTGNLGKTLTQMNLGAKNYAENQYDASSIYNGNPIPQEHLEQMLTPEDYTNLNSWDLDPSLSSEEMLALMPEDVKQNLLDTFSPKSNNQTSLNAGIGSTKSSIGLTPELIRGLKKANPGWSPEDMYAEEAQKIPPEISPETLFSSIKEPANKAKALTILKNNGAATLNPGKVLDNLTTEDMKTYLDSAGGLLGSQKDNFSEKGTIGSAINLAKAAGMAGKGAAISNGTKSAQLFGLKRLLNSKIINPSLGYFDKLNGTNSLGAKLAADNLTSTVVKPFKATKSLESLTNGGIKNPSITRVSKILDTAVEKINNSKNKVDENGKYIRLKDTEIPDNHIVNLLKPKVDKLKQYESTPELSALKEGRFSGNAEEQAKAFKKALDSGKLDPNHKITKMFYAPLKKQLEHEKLMDAVNKSKYNVDKTNIIKNSNNLKTELKSRLEDAMNFQRKLNNNPKFHQSLLMNNAKKIQFASGLSRALIPLIRGKMNAPQN